jgi:hypothetical protein
MKSIAKLRKEVKPGKHSSVVVLAGPCRPGEARPQKHTKTKQRSLQMLHLICSSSPLSSRLRLRRHCAEVLTACPVPRESVRGGPAKKGRGNKPYHHAMLIRLVDVVCKWRFSIFCATVPTQNGSVTRNGLERFALRTLRSALRCIAKLRNIRPKLRPHRGTGRLHRYV